MGVDYSMYTDGFATGVGVSWNADYTKAYYLLDGVKMNETSLSDAEKLAKNKFGLPSPSTKSQLGTASRFGWLLGRERIGADGKPMFKDHGDWGSYNGTYDGSKRHGQGKMTYESGNTYEGSFVSDKFEGDKGIYHWADGDEYEGSWKDGERHGVGIFRSADGTVEYSSYENGAAKGDGVSFAPDRKSANKIVDGEKKHEILIEEAESFSKEKFGLPVPEPFVATPSQHAAVPESVKSIGLFGRLFGKKRVGPDGKMQFKDYGEWGTYDGDFNDDGERHGQGKMTYDSGNYYEGGFVNDQFEGDKGIYHWADGDEYEGSWKDGERHGVGIFRSADGTTEYSTYENGAAKGDGVSFAPDRKSANKTVDGVKKHEILIEEAQALSKEKFDLPAPEPAP